jgi:hypothetical protein
MNSCISAAQHNTAHMEILKCLGIARLLAMFEFGVTVCLPGVRVLSLTEF